MRLPDWRVLVGGLVVVALVGALVVTDAAEPRLVPPPPPSDDGPIRLVRDLVAGRALTVEPGRTYFAALTLHGSASAAANVERVKAQAEKLGFRDVVVSKDAPIADWPPMLSADYFVRGTFRGVASRGLPVHTSVFLGSVDVVDAWVA